jgi:hypothetical protein
MKVILFLQLILATLFGADFYKVDNHIVDTTRNTMWQDTKDDIKIVKDHKSAVTYCENLELDGFSDWRLPSRKDFENIIDKKRKDEEPKIVKVFQYALLEHYWIKDKTWRNFNQWAYYVYLKSGTFYYDNKTYPKYVKCIRDGR